MYFGDRSHVVPVTGTLLPRSVNAIQSKMQSQSPLVKIRLGFRQNGDQHSCERLLPTVGAGKTTNPSWFAGNILTDDTVLLAIGTSQESTLPCSDARILQAFHD